MRKIIKLKIGQRFGKLTVFKSNGMHNGHKMSLCKCDCGQTKSIRNSTLNGGTIKACGCLMFVKKPKYNLVGKRFGKWLVIERAESKKYDTNSTHSMWLCQCDCGSKPKIIGQQGLLDSRSTSCCGFVSAQFKKGHKPKPKLRPNFIGRKFGSLTVVRPAGKNKFDAYLWLCRCDCGQEVVKISTRLKAGRTTTCGSGKCNGRKFDLTGERFGLLTVLCEGGSYISNRKPLWFCRCDCGNKKLVCGDNIRLQRQVSCGCVPGRVKVVEKQGKLLFECNKCNIVKIKDKFVLSPKGKYGIEGICKKCSNQTKRDSVEILSDGYIKQLLIGPRNRVGFDVGDYIPQNVIRLKRLHMQTKRIIKQRKEEIKQCHR